ncbi:radical SAM/SPASM domain-containing protein [Candidatus Omnitrophota bacterium]
MLVRGIERIRKRFRGRGDCSKAPQAIRPGFACFGVIDDCILRCRMCHKWKADPSVKDKELADVASWKRAMRSLRSMVDKGFFLHLGGGEALLLKDILELARFGVDLGFTVNIPTNGYLIDKDMAKRIGDSGLTMMNLSLDSLDEKKHDSLRGVDGVFRRVMEAIEYLDCYAPETKKGICTVINAVNLDDILPLTRWTIANKSLDWIDYMVVVQPNNTPLDRDWYRSEDFGFLWPKDSEKTAEVIDEIIGLKKQGEVKMVNQLCQLEAFKSYFWYPDRFVKKRPCNMDTAVHVSSIGDIFICYRWSVLGNIKRDDLAQVWNSREADKVRDDIGGCKDNCHFLLNCYFEGDYPFSIEE